MTSLVNELNDLFMEMEDVFDGIFQWLASQYDKRSGGFYYAQSSIDDEYLSPDIESTAQALNILQRNELLDNLPEQMKEQLINFFQKKQDNSSGYFYDVNPLMKQDEVMVHRALSYAVGSLRRLGASPLYPLPIASEAAPPYVKSIEAYRKQWDTINFSNSWRGCDRFATSCVYMEEIPENKQKRFVNEAVQYLLERQNKETGLWGEGSLYVQLSGTFKLYTFFSKYQIPFPHKEKIYQSILTCLRTEHAEDMCYIRNPIDLLSYMDVEIPEKELVEILTITFENMSKLKRSDGGFSRELQGSPPAPNVAQVKKGEHYPLMPEPVLLGRGKVEGDMNATTQATLIRLKCHRLAGQKVVPIKGSEQFYSYL
ncbi:prenyltransferase/squalene oxidase repeat-containing protein [Alkalihalobacillus sp. LMS39]|uniref:prenyltransferase/squalene oxidase repeat-containing protein n=1 Tax=Alkalihalobacillus sp. LMS39 TaxID=2924032 RepID=UPI001FB20998|nr:prenyltransferase/squalene oxidase repeat-containing protein [Alkalihalobacillus sp. LMS39]UOE93051.1 terpene cyclase/mutase family protein [Alkalihalobacillus sp. LMS39]